MKRIVTRTLAHLGLAPAGHVARLREEGERTTQKLHEIEQRVVQFKADAELWKRRQEETARRAGEQEQAAARATARAERAEARAEELKARGDALAAEAKEMRARLQEANRSAGTVREHLMATETKLDLIEAALQVLDARTRAAVAPREQEKLRT